MNRTVAGRTPGEKPPKVSGTISIPASKSHTIRALLIAAFAEGESRLRRPLLSRDSVSCRRAVEALGATVTDDGPDWVVQGFGSRPKPPGTALPGSAASHQSPGTPSPVTIDVGNSGTTLYLAAALAALSEIPIRFDGDEQIRRRSAAPLLDALKAMGARVEASPGGCAPFTVKGPLKAGTLSVDCPVSQYLSALLLAAPLISLPAGGGALTDGNTSAWGSASSLTESTPVPGGASTDERPDSASARGNVSADEWPDSASARGNASTLTVAASPRGEASNLGDPTAPQNSGSGLNTESRQPRAGSAPGVSKKPLTTIKVNSLNEAPYVGITLDWMEAEGIEYEREGWDEFRIPAGQSYRAFDRVVPADWSSATFFLVAAAVTRGTLTLEGLDYNDSQGDKAVLDMLAKMGCETEVFTDSVKIIGRPMKGAVLDLNATPDALPAMAVAACFAEGETRLINVPQARLKETDRIAVMTSELLKLGVDAQELPDGMVIRGRGEGSCKGAVVEGHDDHRVVMALAVAAIGGCGELTIRGTEAADVTFPGFFELLDEALERSGTEGS